MAETSVNNGVNVDALLAAREVLKGAPEAAKFTWRASCKWQNGTHSLSKVEGFHGLGAEQKHKTEFSFETDHPEVFASEDVPPGHLAIARLLRDDGAWRLDASFELARSGLRE